MGSSNIISSIIQWFRAFFNPKANPTEPVIISASTISSRPIEGFPEPSRGIVTWKTLLSSPSTPTNSLTVGIATCQPKTGHLCPHRHTHAELYHITEGQGVMTIDGKEHHVEKGSVVYVPGNAEHGIRNDDPEIELKWLYVFAADGFDEIKYRFPGE